MNKNEYRRALIMLRSLKPGVSGYVRLERRTLLGTMQFTINGVQADGELYAVLLYKNGGGLSAVRLEKFAAPRYGQTGLVWKFDPRNIENRTLEQYEFAAVIEIRSGLCDLMLCGNLNGSVEADWAQVRDASCRLFSPVRICKAPIPPIDEKSTADDRKENDGLQTLPDFSEESPAFPGRDNAALDSQDSCEACAASDEWTEPDELDVPALDNQFTAQAQPVQSDNFSSVTEMQSSQMDDLDVPAQEDLPPEVTAGEQLALNDPNAEWPESIEPLRSLFFSSEAVSPFEADGYVFIRAPLPADCGTSSCLIGLKCEKGVPKQICYAIPAAYTSEPPVGLEGYIWKGDRTRGYWAISEELER